MFKKKVLKYLSKTILIGTLALGFISCGDNNKSNEKENPKLSNKNVVHIYSWAEYIPPEVFDNFEKETGIKVIEDIYSTNEEMFTKLKSGATGYDIVLPSPDYVEIMMKENMLEKIDKNKISTFKNLDQDMMKKLRAFDKNNEYAIPYAISATVIAVNTKYVKDFPRSYDIYEMESLRGRMTLLDDLKENIIAALAYEGYPQNTSDKEAFKKAEKRLLRWRKNLAKFDSDSFGKNFASEDFLVVQGYAENIYFELTDEQIEHTEFFIPENAGSFSIDSFVLLKTAPDKENAYKFIEYIHRPEVYKLVADYLMLPCINVPARKLAEEEPIFKIEALKNAALLRDTSKTLDMQNEVWENIRMRN
ncbi:extracellular solute-binding protein [Fusobacterium sp. IOR10]|uniref:extracellular solute-binding protein n=1 Tax=Fusobacterium sp. IOR10 TaxID=2665157 RepID=UPI0013D43EDD|nr:extracellular solute-binding protein [Fusobacterium sp. IOR10]